MQRRGGGPCFLLALWTAVALAAPRAGAEQPGAGGSETGAGEPRLVLEGFGGLATLAASDLNGLVGYDDQVRNHLFDSQLERLQERGEIESWDRTRTGERPEIRTSWTAGARAKLRLTRGLALSLGLDYLSASSSEDLQFRYAGRQYGDERIEELSYSPYSLAVEAYAPELGLHLSRPLKPGLEAELFVRGGPLFAKFEHVSHRDYAFSMAGPSMNGLVFETTGGLEGRGEGTGMAVNLGVRLRYALARRVAAFLEGGYAYRKVTTLSGPGSDFQGDETTSWNGEWVVRRDTLAAPWGTAELELPTNRWPEAAPGDTLRDFELDLSGFGLMLGLSIGI